MKKIICLVLLLITVLSLTSCSKNDDGRADEVVVNISKDASVNGYREKIKTELGEMPDKIDGSQVAVGNPDISSREYCGNKNSKVFHKVACDSVSAMNESNKVYAKRDKLISSGYKPCGKCNP